MHKSGEGRDADELLPGVGGSGVLGFGGRRCWVRGEPGKKGERSEVE